jgi:hypothetical protein
LLQVALVPVLVLASELLYRVWGLASGSPYSSSNVEAEIRRIADEVNQSVDEYAPKEASDESDRRRIQHPFFGWDHVASQNRLGEKSTYFARAGAARNFDILIVGGSVANGFAGQGRERLIELLEQDPRLARRDVRTHGRAFGGAKQPQQINVVTYVLGLGWKPDAIVNIDGFNEVALAAQNAAIGVHPIHPSAAHWSHLIVDGGASRGQLDLQFAMREAQVQTRRTSDRALRWGLHHSALFGGATLSRLQGLRREYSRLHDSYATYLAAEGRGGDQLGPAFEGTLDEAVDLSLLAWAESSRALQGICNANGMVYVHALQPTMYHEGSKRLTAEEVAVGGGTRPQIEAVRYGYPLMRRLGRDLAADGVGFVDTSMLFQDVEHTLYIDLCHYLPEGQERLAEAVAEALLERLP